ncbi:uncharacterized protein LOC110637311 isoform X2 [Hevea brasiliensis]|uniref:uncharacterized protein LOC110637311 isoform X2 n=1 Tax=Hevea brasiliensis TaxID=3981 RepID=UPI0025E27843|nr:uncharacterized protein LOC110637311 isoform X2 [Hevea brasiliensis]
MSEKKNKKKPKAVILGGSIAGVSCAHALILAGWDIVVLEKSNAPPKGSPTGAGLGIDPLAQQIIQSWLPQPELLQEATLPLTIDQNIVTGGDKSTRILTRDENFNFGAAHWADLHSLLYDALPPEIFLWGHVYLSFCISEDQTSVNVKAKSLQTNEIIEINGDLLIAADGCLSSIRRTFLPDIKLSGTHSVLYELPKKKLNWIWYVHQPEPEVKGNSVTMKVSSDMINNMYQEAEKVWLPELVQVMKETEEPFLNFIYDCDPLEQIFWGNVVLIGDAAHPTTPHGLRSTNMSILDAAVLGKCLQKWGLENLPSALEEYQSVRVPVISQQVLHSRRLGRIKQGLYLPDRGPFDPNTASPEDGEELQQKNMPFFSGAPISAD